MLIRHQAEVVVVRSKRGTENTHAALILQLAIRLDRIRPEDRGNLMGFTGEEIEVTLRAEDHVDPAEPRPMEQLWSTNGSSGEHTRPGPEESCSACGKVIGDDAAADFHTPLAGPPSPVCGACALDADDLDIAADDDDVTQFDDQDGQVVTLDAEGEIVGAGEDAVDEPLGDGPMPPVSSPIRRGRARAASGS